MEHSKQFKAITSSLLETECFCLNYEEQTKLETECFCLNYEEQTNVTHTTKTNLWTKWFHFCFRQGGV